jgi:tetratricopeptide (TPR) repeat protein
MPGPKSMLIASVCVLLVLPVRVGAQIPDEFTNLKVLPKDISKGELMGTMKGFTAALGVRCDNCHVDKEGRGFEGFDFASDDKKEKQTARLMMQMVHEINSGYVAKIDEPADQRVTVECMTCHRGQKRPRMLEDVLAATVKAEGVDSAIAQYHALRERYYGRHTFDFGEWTLLEVAETCMADGDTDGAITFIELNKELFPESGITLYQLGEAYAAAGRTEDAIAEFEACQKLMPNPRITKRIEELKQQ